MKQINITREQTTIAADAFFTLTEIAFKEDLIGEEIHGNMIKIGRKEISAKEFMEAVKTLKNIVEGTL